MALDLSTAMKLLHSSNSKRTEAEKDPLAKEVLSKLKELKKLQVDLHKAVDSKDDATVKAIKESIASLKKDMEEKGVSSEFFGEGGDDKLRDYLKDEVLAELKNYMKELRDDMLSALVKMLQTGKSPSDDSKTSKELEESLILSMSTTLNKAGLTNGKDIKTVILYLKSLRNDMDFGNKSISKVIQLNMNKQFKMLENLPYSIMDTMEFGKWQKYVNAALNPIGFIKSIYLNVTRVLGLVWRVIIPTLVSMAVTFFTTVLPMILLAVAIVALIIIVLYLMWKHFGGYIKKLWGYVKEYVVDFIVMTWNNLKEFISWAWDTLKFIWGVLTDVYDFVDMIFSGNFTGAGVIIMRLMDRIVDYISSTFEHIFNVFSNFGGFLSKLPIIGPVFKFLFDIFMPFMRFFIDAFKWVYSFIKDYVSVVWDNLVGIIGVVKAIFSGDFDGATVIIEQMFERTKNFIVDNVLSVLEILQKLGNSLLMPIMWIWDSFKVAWDYYLPSFSKAWEYIKSIPDALVGGVKNLLSGIGDALNPFNWFAEGGVVEGPTKAIIGEAGPEAVLPLQGSGKNTLMGVLNDFFDTFLPFLKPLVNFLWDNFKPYIPILQAVLDSIYSVVYSIISGLAKLPGWLGGEFFANMLSRLAAPKAGTASSSSSSKDAMFILSILGDEIRDKPVLSVVGKNKAEVSTFDSNKKPMTPATFKELSGYVSNVSNGLEEPSYARDIQKGISKLGDGMMQIADKLTSMEKNIIGAVGQSTGKTTVQDKQFELANLISRNNFNGGRI